MRNLKKIICLIIGIIIVLLIGGAILNKPTWEYAMAYKHPDKFYWDDTINGFWPKSFVDTMETNGIKEGAAIRQIDVLKYAGNNGWELVAVGEDDKGAVLYFKRPK